MSIRRGSFWLSRAGDEEGLEVAEVHRLAALLDGVLHPLEIVDRYAASKGNEVTPAIGPGS
jgi:hypothetical protein